MADQIDSKTSGIQPFSFDTLSPDDAVRQARENGDLTSPMNKTRAFLLFPSLFHPSKLYKMIPLLEH